MVQVSTTRRHARARRAISNRLTTSTCQPSCGSSHQRRGSQAYRAIVLPAPRAWTRRRGKTSSIGFTSGRT